MVGDLCIEGKSEHLVSCTRSICRLSQTYSLFIVGLLYYSSISRDFGDGAVIFASFIEDDHSNHTYQGRRRVSSWTNKHIRDIETTIIMCN